MSICFTPIVTAQVCFVLTSPRRAHRVTHQKEEGKRKRQHTLYAIAVLAISLSMITKHNLQYDARMIIYLDCWFIHWGETLASYTWVILIFVPTNCTSTLISILSIYSSNCNKTYWNCLYRRFSTSQKATLLMVCIRLQSRLQGLPGSSIITRHHLSAADRGVFYIFHSHCINVGNCLMSWPGLGVCRRRS